MTGLLTWLRNLSPTTRQLRAILDVIARNGRGVHKRIDENRELLELLQREAPQLLQSQPWVIGWLSSQDAFLTGLAKVSGVPNPLPTSLFPRPWPEANPKNAWHRQSNQEK